MGGMEGGGSPCSIICTGFAGANGFPQRASLPARRGIDSCCPDFAGGLSSQVQQRTEEDFSRGFPAEALSGSGVEEADVLADVRLRQRRKVRASRYVLAEQSIDVFNGRSLPWGMRMREVERNLMHPFRYNRMGGEFRSAVGRDRFHILWRYRGKQPGHYLRDIVGELSFHLAAKKESALSVHHRDHAATVDLALDRVRFPVPNLRPLVGGVWTFGQFVGNNPIAPALDFAFFVLPPPTVPKMKHYLLEPSSRFRSP